MPTVLFTNISYAMIFSKIIVHIHESTSCTHHNNLPSNKTLQYHKKIGYSPQYIIISHKIIQRALYIQSPQQFAPTKYPNLIKKKYIPLQYRLFNIKISSSKSVYSYITLPPPIIIYRFSQTHCSLRKKSCLTPSYTISCTKEVLPPSMYPSQSIHYIILHCLAFKEYLNYHI